jgi:hypothetical protein
MRERFCTGEGNATGGSAGTRTKDEGRGLTGHQFQGGIHDTLIMSAIFESVLKQLKARYHDDGELAKLIHEDSVIDKSLDHEPSELKHFLQGWPCEVTILHAVSTGTEA